MRLKLVLAALLFVCSTATYGDTQSKAQTAEKDCANQLDALIQSMETKVSTSGVESNVNKLTIRIVRKIQGEEGSCAAFQAINKQFESNGVLEKDEQKK
ncbi:MAG: hypothetical protein WA632_15745 [Gallionella sp.]